MALFDWLFGRNASQAPGPTSANSKTEVEKRLVENESPTEGYRPPLPGHLFYQYGNSTPPLHLFYWDWQSQMHLHPRVQMAMDTYKAGISEAKIIVTGKNPVVNQYAQEQFDRLWSTSLPTVQEGYDLGWGAFEPMYRFDDNGRLAFDILRSFDPYHTKLLFQGDRYYGIRVYNVQGKDKPVDLWGAATHGLAKAFWYAHLAKHGRYVGWPQAFGAWRPWRRLAIQGGAEDIIDMAVYRFGIQGPVVWFNPAQKNYDADKRDPRNPSNRDLARQMAEQVKAGASCAFPSEYDQAGNLLWGMEWPAHVIDVDSLINYNGSLEKLIDLGIGVPPEINDSGDKGGMGYRGREIPLESYLAGQTKVARGIVHQFNKQVVLPLVKWEFGDDVSYDVDVEAITKTRRDMERPDDPNMNGVPGGKPPSKPPMPGSPPPPPINSDQKPQESFNLSTIVEDNPPKRAKLDEPEAQKVFDAIMAALALVNADLVDELIDAINAGSTIDRWDRVQSILTQYRETVLFALSEAGLAGTLAAMRWVGNQIPIDAPASGFGPPSAPPPRISGADFGDRQPVIRLTMIDEAVKDLANRGIVDRAEFDQLSYEAKQQAFTVAGVEGSDTLEAIKNSLADATAEGWSRKTWQRNLREALKDDPFLSPRHQETVFRTNIQSAYSKGLDRVLDHPFVGTYFPYEAIHPILDNRVRPHHAALQTSGINGTNIYRRDDPTYQVVKPPSDFNCRCGRRPVTVDQAAKSGVQEAEKWKETGKEPLEKAWVPLPTGWEQSPGFRRLATLPPSSAPAQQTGGWFEKWRDDLAAIFAAANLPTPFMIRRLSGGPAESAGHYHAPPGGITLRGKEFKGGEFIYADDFAAGTPEQQQQIKAHTESVQGTGQGVVSVADELARVYGPPKGKRYTQEAAEYFGAVGAEIHKRYGDEWQARVAELKHKLEGALGSEAAIADPKFRNKVMGKLSGLNWIMQHPPTGAKPAAQTPAKSKPTQSIGDTPAAIVHPLAEKPEAAPITSAQGQDGVGVDTATVGTPPAQKPTVNKNPKPKPPAEPTDESQPGFNAQRVQARKKAQDHEAKRLIDRIRKAHQELRDMGEDPGIDPENDPAIIRARAADDQSHAARLEAANRADELTKKLNKLRGEKAKHESSIAALKEQLVSKPKTAEPTPKKEDAAHTHTFKTSKGSTYKLHSDGTTIRNKSDHSGALSMHKKSDVGEKERSAKTIYVDKQHAAALSGAGLTDVGGKGHHLVINGNKASLVSWNKKANNWGASPSGRDVEFSTEPKVGMSPVEMWDRHDKIGGMEGYSNQHAGNDITEITEHGKEPKQDTANRDPWNMTKAQFSAAFPGHGRKKEHISHEDLVKAMLAMGNKIPDEVLADYPHLQNIKRMSTAVGQEFADAMRLVDEASLQLKELVVLSTIDSIISAAATVDPNPSDDQKKAGNYSKGHLTWKGLPITIETAKGQTRSGKDKSGTPWSIEMKDHYGYIKRTEYEADGDHIDVFLCEDHPDSEIVFVVNQNNPGGPFDEHKVVLGQMSFRDAKAAYLRNYCDGWKGCGSIRAMTLEQFKEWIENGDTSKAI